MNANLLGCNLNSGPPGNCAGVLVLRATLTPQRQGCRAASPYGWGSYLLGSLWWGFERVVSSGADAGRSLRISAQGNDGGVGVAPGAFRIRFRP
jgi:hypothetical protein